MYVCLNVRLKEFRLIKVPREHSEVPWFHVVGRKEVEEVPSSSCDSSESLPTYWPPLLSFYSEFSPVTVYYPPGVRTNGPPGPLVFHRVSYSGDGMQGVSEVHKLRYRNTGLYWGHQNFNLDSDPVLSLTLETVVTEALRTLVWWRKRRTPRRL